VRFIYGLLVVDKHAMLTETHTTTCGLYDPTFRMTYAFLI